MDPTLCIYDEKTKLIESMEFNVLGNDEIKKISVFGKEAFSIDVVDLYDNLEPKARGLIDTHMGVTESNINCSTCGLSSTYCIGHFGHIQLADPVFHLGYLDYVKKILSCICLRCSKLLIYKDSKDLEDLLKNKYGKYRLNEIKNLVKNIQYCQLQNNGCGAPVQKIKKEIKKKTGEINLITEIDVTNIHNIEKTETSKKIRRKLTPENCYDIFKNISDTDIMILGFDPIKFRPEMLIHKIFPVPPVQIRPTVKNDGEKSYTMVDDLTIKLTDIIKANNRLLKHKESGN